jgi:nicotinamide mononucleotide adenylyltransferase
LAATDGVWAAQSYPLGYESEGRLVRVALAAPANLVDSMDNTALRAVNVFFSNFSETAFEDYSQGGNNDRALIGFAMRHNVINIPELFQSDAESNSYIEPKNVDATIEKYFGDIKVTPQSSGDFIGYRDGKYYWDDVFEGSPWFAGSQTLELRDNGNGTLSAIVEDYADNDNYQANPDSELVRRFYEPKKTWSAAVAKLFDVKGYHAALIEPYEYQGKKTYRLIKWRAAETLQEAQRLVAEGL